MADLEDRILRQNVPGRWSSLDDRNDVRNDDPDALSHSSDEEGDSTSKSLSEEKEMIEFAKKMDFDGVPEPVKRKILADRESKHGTGVKGVLADYKMNMELEAAQRHSDAAERARIIDRIVKGAVRVEETEDTGNNESTAISSLTTALSRLQKNKQHEPDSVDNDKLESAFQDAGLGLDSDDEDDEFMLAFREKRMQEMMSAATCSNGSADEQQNTLTPLPQFGECIDVSSGEEFLRQIDQEDKRVTVVVHLYESNIQACETLSDHLHSIAHSWRDVKFISMKASESGVYIDPVALPALSVYRGGKCLTVITSIAEELSSGNYGGTRSGAGSRFTRDDVEWLLETSEGWSRRTNT
mmetsp:Transcript_3033/g.4633  ORF Transcript_3033/g.4633 Transcript_3033/m.4633 type:complete len:355 (+) Transcript_3033:61-1125(+)|eukprot:CAMPEP_0185031780 /NCGR_PEP_ID=MMETSP1103-20130426/19425_1 /TAXON_ID=36769 /ORGANISM="Paraphysomonas bandaiensis, Strain Caron Lab Isolate" /LENGTH=354 /DNA_ID=CAMNT_0027567419 /DNA_START=8 /DNA_END=1072 /DNA_ORIENTATION=+